MYSTIKDDIDTGFYKRNFQRKIVDIFLLSILAFVVLKRTASLK